MVSDLKQNYNTLHTQKKINYPRMHKNIQPSSSSYFIYPNSIVFHENSLFMTFIILKKVCQWGMKTIHPLSLFEIQSNPLLAPHNSTTTPHPNFPTPQLVLNGRSLYLERWGLYFTVGCADQFCQPSAVSV